MIKLGCMVYKNSESSKLYLQGVYNTYYHYREFELRLPRNEVEEVDQLRDKWQELMELAEEVRHKLLIEKRGTFEQELDKQVKVNTKYLA